MAITDCHSYSQETPFEDAPEEAPEAPDTMSVRSLTGRSSSYSHAATNEEEPKLDRDDSPMGTADNAVEEYEHGEAEKETEQDAQEDQAKPSSPRLSVVSVASLDNVNLDDDIAAVALPPKGKFDPAHLNYVSRVFASES